MPTVFDPVQFANTQITEANATKYETVPEGEYPAIIAPIDAQKNFRTLDKGQVVLDIFWNVDSQEVSEATGMESPRVRQSIFLDISEQGTLEGGRGKNIALGRLRDAVGLNNPGQPFSFSMLSGRAALIKVTHRMGKDRSGEDTIFTDVASVTRL